MVDTAFLAIGGFVFLLLLVVILYSAAPAEEREKPARVNKASKGKKKPVPKKGAKKDGVKKAAPSTVKEVFIVGESRVKEEDRNMLEFLKGRDPKEIARVLQRENKQARKKDAKPVVAAVAEVHEEEEEDDEDFAVIQRKTQEKPKKEAKVEKEGKKKKEKPKSSSFFKEEKKPVDPKAPRRQRRDAPPTEGEAVEGEAKDEKGKPEGERPPRRERAPRLNADGEVEERRPRGDNVERRAPRKPIAVPTVSLSNVELDVNSFMDFITADEERKAREASKFSILERRTVLQILGYLSVGQLLSLSRVNKYFNNICKAQSLWQSLAAEHFNLKSLGKNRLWIQAYKSEYKRRNKKPQEKSDKEGKAEKDVKQEDVEKKQDK